MGILISLIVSLFLNGNLKPNFRLYPETAVITDIQQDRVTVECANGNLFDFYGAEDLEEGDLVAMIMCDKGTTVVYDDEIMTIKYAGTPAMFNK